MKIKSDFVTNSSTTCYLVIFDTKIKTFWDIFAQIEGLPIIWKLLKYIEEHKTYKEEYQIQSPLKLEWKSGVILSIAREITYGWCDIDEIDPYNSSHDYETNWLQKHYGVSRYFDLIDLGIIKDKNDWSIRSKLYRDQDRDTLSRAIKHAKKIVKEHDGKYMYRFEFGNESNYSELENHNTFKHVPFIEISHH